MKTRLASVLGSFLAVCSFATAQVLYGGTGHYYELVVSQNLSWTNSNAGAAARTFNGWNGHLATLTSQGENDFVITLIGVGPVWIGGFQAPGSSEPAGGWGWTTGETWSYSNWGPGEPNNEGGPFGNEDKLAFGSVTPLYSGWGDLPDNGGYAVMRGFVVEYEPVPEPTIAISLAMGVALVVLRRK